MFKKVSLILIAVLLTACGGTVSTQPVEQVVHANAQIRFSQWDVPHTNLTMLLPDGWVTEYYQGDISIASDGQNLFYSPYEPFEGVLVKMFLSDGPRAIGPSFDVMQLATDFVADQPNVTQAPTLVEDGGRQIVTTMYANTDSKGQPITNLTGFVLDNQQLTVFLAATPTETELIYLPVLQQMLFSIEIQTPYK